MGVQILMWHCENLGGRRFPWPDPLSIVPAPGCALSPACSRAGTAITTARSVKMSDENLIAWGDTSEATIRDDLVIYPASLGDEPIEAAVTIEALNELWTDKPAGGAANLPEATDPVHGAAQTALQRKLDLIGLNADRAILVTARDLGDLDIGI
jgi:hypothetical protein